MRALSRRNLLIGGAAAAVAAGVASWFAVQPKEYAAGPVFSEEGLLGPPLTSSFPSAVAARAARRAGDEKSAAG